MRLTAAEIEKKSAASRAAWNHPLTFSPATDFDRPKLEFNKSGDFMGIREAAKPQKGSTSRQKRAGSAGEQELATQLRLCRIFGWKREYMFHPKRLWRLDFGWPTQRLAVEVEGGVWTDGRHTRGSGFIQDLEKYNNLAILHWRLLRFTPEMVKSGVAVATIAEALK